MFKISSTYICWINIWNATLEVKLGVKRFNGMHNDRAIMYSVQMFSSFVDISWSTRIFQFEAWYILISSTVVSTRFTFGKLIILYYQPGVYTVLTKTRSTSPCSSSDAILVTDSCTITDHNDKLRNSMILGALIRLIRQTRRTNKPNPKGELLTHL
jgi:hypothetical protein